MIYRILLVLTIYAFSAITAYAASNTPVITFDTYATLTAAELNTMQEGLVPANAGTSLNQSLTTPTVVNLLTINNTTTSSAVIALQNKGTAIATIGSDTTNTFYLLDSTQTGSPWAITLYQGQLSLGETGKTVAITGNLLVPSQVCLDSSCYRYIYETDEKVYIGNTKNGNVFSIDDSGNVITKGTVTASGTP